MVDTAPLARSPIAPVGPVQILHGWQVPTGTPGAPGAPSAGLHLTDLSALAKVAVRAPADSPAARALGAGSGRAARSSQGHLVVGSGPGEWLILGPMGSASTVRAFAKGLPGAGAAAAGADEPGDGLVTVIDLTHGRALVRLTGPDGPALLAKVCAIDLSDKVTPNGAAFRTSVAKLVTDVVRDDVPGDDVPVADGSGARSYLLHCERSSGQYLFDCLLDAGAEYGVQVTAPSVKGDLT